MALTNITREELQNLLTQLEQALYNHVQWHNTLVRTFVCKLPVDKHNISPKAHKECLFGQWYYNNSPKKLQDHPGFLSMGEAHKHMHLLTTQLLLTFISGRPIETREYDAFSNAMDRLRLELASLKHEVEISLYTRDPLTGAINRADMLPMLRELHEAIKRQSEVCSIAMMDLDLFKNVNDKFGHSAGDVVLSEVVQYITDNIRPYDKIYRYGGEEFLLSMQNTDVASCFERVEELRKGISNLPINIGRKDPIHITASFGIAIMDPLLPIEECIDHADKALYTAKSSGRNCTKIWKSSTSGTKIHVVNQL